MASDFQDQFREAMREAEVADLKRQFDEASAKATSAFNNPLDIAQKEVEAAFGTDPSGGDKSAATHAVATADPGAIEPSAGAPSSEAPPSVVPDAPMVSADGTIEIKPDSAKQGGAA
jgi:sec-independent protein translocase protein TatB